MVAAKNASYGFARNLLGVRWIGALLTLTVGLGDTWLAFRALGSGMPEASNLAAAAAVNLAMAAVWLFAVRPGWVRLEAEAYGLALLECCEPDLSKKPRTTGATPGRSTRRKAAPDGTPPTATQAAGD